MSFQDTCMSDTHSPRLGPETLDILAGALSTIGVAGNEDDRRFEADEVEASRKSLEDRLRGGGHNSGILSVDTLAVPHGEVDVLIYDRDRYGSLSQAEQAWELDYRHRRRAEVQQRVDDWLRRLRDLRSSMSDWISVPEFSALSIVDRAPAIMSEDLMRRFDIGPKDMPVFEIHVGAKRVMRVQPKGLWVIGANGRVDVITKAAAPILFDRSAPLARPSAWHIYDSTRPGPFVPLDAESFKALIRAGIE